MSLSPLHYLNIGAEGKFQASGDYPSSPTTVDALFAHLQNETSGKLTVHFHGGLVPIEDGMKIAANMAREYAGVSHAYSVVWQTGLLEILIQRFDKVQETILFKELKKIVIRKVFEKLGIEENARGSGPMDKKELEFELAQLEPFARLELRARGGAERLDESDLPLLESEIEAELEAELDMDADFDNALQTASQVEEFDKSYIPETKPGGKGGVSTYVILRALAKIAIRVIRRLMHERDHGIYPTTVEEILRTLFLADFGTTVWDSIKEKAREKMWSPNIGGSDSTQYAGTYFLEKLDAFLGAHPNWRLDLVGHSAGSIAICHLLRAIATQQRLHVRIRNIFLLAPACRARLFYDEILTKPERYHSIRMFTMTDAAEQADHLGGVAYTRSLLYFVSALLENKSGASSSESDDLEVDGDYFILGLERHLQARPPYQNSKVLQEIRAFFGQPGRLVLSPTGECPQNQGNCSNSRKHGAFDDDKDTLTSLKMLIAQ